MPRKLPAPHPPKTEKQIKFVQELAKNGGNKTAAAKVAYNTDDNNTATNLAHYNMKVLGIPDLMERMGMTDEALMEDLVEGLNANKVISANIYANGEHGKPINDFIDVPDHAVRHKWWTDAMKLKGHLKENPVQVNIFAGLKTEQVTYAD